MLIEIGGAEMGPEVSAGESTLSEISHRCRGSFKAFLRDEALSRHLDVAIRRRTAGSSFLIPLLKRLS